jgi:hypothetical protein
MFRVLLGAGARWHALDHEGHTALDVAVRDEPARPRQPEPAHHTPFRVHATVACHACPGGV